MEIVLVADKCYPYIAKTECKNCGRQFLAEYSDEGIRLFGNVCECCSICVPAEGYPSYEEWTEIRREGLEKKE